MHSLRPSDTSLLHYRDSFTPSLNEDRGITGQHIPSENNAIALEGMLVIVKTVDKLHVKVWGKHIVFEGIMLQKILSQIMGTSEEHFIYDVSLFTQYL